MPPESALASAGLTARSRDACPLSGAPLVGQATSKPGSSLPGGEANRLRRVSLVQVIDGGHFAVLGDLRRPVKTTKANDLVRIAVRLNKQEFRLEAIWGRNGSHELYLQRRHSSIVAAVRFRLGKDAQVADFHAIRRFAMTNAAGCGVRQERRSDVWSKLAWRSFPRLNQRCEQFARSRCAVRLAAAKLTVLAEGPSNRLQPMTAKGRIFQTALCAALALAGCSRQPTGTVLRLSNWGGADDDSAFASKIQGLYADYERAHPGISVHVEGIPGEYVPKMILSMVAKSPPDVMAVDASSAGVFINNGTLRDLSPFIAKDAEFNQNDYFGNSLATYRQGKSLYAIPGDFTPMAMYYNKRLFDTAHVPYPPAHWTFDQFLETAQKLTIPGKQYGFKFTNWMPGWVMWLWNNGGDVLDPKGTKATGFIDSGQNATAIAFLRDLIQRYKVAPSLSAAEASGVDPFATGTAAMTISGHWEIPGYVAGKKIALNDLGVVELPSNIGASSTVIYEVGYGIPKDCQHPEEAWKLIRYLTSQTFQRTYQSTGIAVCARQDIAKERAINPIDIGFLNIVPTGRPPRGASFVGYDFVEAEGVKMLDAVLAGETPHAALHRMATRIDEYLRVR